MSDVNEVIEMIKSSDVRINARLNEIEKRANRPRLGGGDETQLTPEQSEHRKAFDRYLRKGDDSGLKAMQTGSDPDGGYLVLPEIDREIDRIAPTVSAMFAICNVKTIGTAKYEKRVKTSGMAMRRVADGTGGGETQEPKFANIAIEVFTGEVEPWINNETLEDGFIDIEADLADEAAIGFAEGGGGEFINGNGVGCARGLLSYPVIANSAYAWGSIGYIASGKSAAFASVAPADKIINLQHALKPRFRQGAVFLMNDSTLAVVRQLKDGSGAYYLWQPDPAAAFGGRLLGHEVVIDDNMPSIAAGAYAIAFGNFKRGYTIVNRTGTTLIRDPYTTKGQTKFNFRRRFSGGISHFEAIKLMKFSTG